VVRLACSCASLLACAALGLAGCTTDYQDFGTQPGSSSASAASSVSSASATTGTGGTGAVGGGATGGHGGAGTGGEGGVAPPCQGNTDQLQDDFDDGLPAAAWSPYTQGQGVNWAEAAGQLLIGAINSGGSYYDYAGYRAGPFDITGCAVLIHAVTLPADQVQAYIGFLTYDASDGVAVAADESTVYLCVTTGSVPDCTAEAHAPEGDGWWRIREAAGTMSLEMSPEGKTWTVRRTLTTPAFATAGYVDIGAGSSDPIDFAYAAGLDDYNRPPP